MASQWIRNSNIDNPKPRKLTTTEIDEILSYMPQVGSSSNVAARLAREQIMAENRRQLSRIELVPTELAKKKLIYVMVRRFEIARANDGDSYGNGAAFALASSATQLTLDTHKNIGGRVGAGSSLTTLTDICYASKTAKERNGMMRIHFRTPVSSDDVIDMRSIVVETRLDYFIKGSARDIIVAPLEDRGLAIEDPSLFEVKQSIAESGVERLPAYWWHESYRNFRQVPLNATTHIARIKLDAVKLYAHGVTPAKIAALIEGTFGVQAV